jgi:hypothetical protein
MQRFTRVRGAFVLTAGLLTLVPAAWSAASAKGFGGLAPRGGQPAGSAAEKVGIRVVSGRADMVSGGDALIEITGVATTPATPGVSVTVNGRDLTNAFRAASPGGPLLGRIDALTPGKNTVEVRAGGKPLARLDLTNHPSAGPIFSGPHQTPFICQTEDAGLGPALDGDCHAKTVVTYVYKSDAPPVGRRGGGAPAAVPTPAALPAGFKPFDPEGGRPADLAHTTTTEGRTIDYIVRRERGVINRAIYEIAFLHVPGEPLPDPWTKTPGWNGRLVYSFGGGCSAGYRQGRAASAINDVVLSGGYASAASTLNVFGNNCNDVISAETLMMVKEHFIERFGAPIHTIGTGGSGGSMQQHLIAQNYPGLLDGITPSVSFPDTTTVVSNVVDCSLLAHAFDGSQQAWTDDQKTAVSGFATWRTCSDSWTRTFSPNFVLPTACDASIPRSQVYDPKTNPTGARCTIQDNLVNIYGRDPSTGFARRPLDNVGVQYGLAALNSGAITAAQFLELNERIGGYDADGNIIEARSVADPVALRLAYATGRVNTAGGSLAAIPIIDSRPYLDPTGNLHDSFRSFATRARLVAANGRADNQVILRMPNNRGAGPGANNGGGDPGAAIPVNTIRMMDRWLDGIASDRSSDPPAVKVVRNRPADVADACFSEQGEKIVEPASYTGAGRCNQLYPPHADPRIAAGGPLADDILKCELKPIDQKDYKQPFTTDQQARLKAVFPKGVCDYSRPGVEQRRVSGSWKRS